uniref:Autoinducer 2 import system permease protein LsrD n=1 Tax=Thermodesulfobacterium geofontis TaxID=1295609 RepID=A0A7V4N4S7_9BACT
MAFRLFIEILKRKEISVLVILLIVISFFYSLQPVFLSTSNTDALRRITPELSIPALGITMLMITGEFDLSIGSVFGFTPILAATLMDTGINAWVSISFSLLICCLIGAIHGIITTKANIPSFITTLGGMLIWRGAALAITGGMPKYFHVPPEIANILTRSITGSISFHVQELWLITLTIVFSIILFRHKFGNWMLATGGNKEAARALGINTSKVKTLCFMLCSLMAGFGGIMQSTRLAAALPNQGDGLEFDAIAAAVIGGTSLYGGSGTIIGTVIGGYLSRVIENGLVIIRAPSYYYRLYIGIIIIIAVIMNLYLQRRAMKVRG